MTQQRGISLKNGENPSDTQHLSETSSAHGGEKKPKRRKRDVKIDVYRAWCKACTICVAFCPAHVFTKDEEGYPQVEHPEDCINCGWCEIHCPDFAITVQEKKTPAKPE